MRSLLRRHLPATLGIGQGFVRTPKGITSQLDVIVYDLNYPRHLHEGDLVIVNADAVRAIVEVKSSTDGNQLRNDLSKLAGAATLCRHLEIGQRVHQDGRGPFVGYFSFTSLTTPQEDVLAEALRNSVLEYPAPLKIDVRDPDLQQDPRVVRWLEQREAIKSQSHRAAINALALGPNIFIRHWNAGEEAGRADDQIYWKKYNLPSLAFGYFITNLIRSVNPHSIALNHEDWWPAEGKGDGRRIPYPQRVDFSDEWPPRQIT